MEEEESNAKLHLAPFYQSWSLFHNICILILLRFLGCFARIARCTDHKYFYKSSEDLQKNSTFAHIATILQDWTGDEV